MAEAKTKSGTKSKKSTTKEVVFKCRLCGKQKPISEMKVIKRFRPVIVICQDCEKVIQ